MKDELRAPAQPYDNDFDKLILELKRKAPSQEMLEWAAGIVYNLMSMGHNCQEIAKIMNLRNSMEVWL